MKIKLQYQGSEGASYGVQLSSQSPIGMLFLDEGVRHVQVIRNSGQMATYSRRGSAESETE